MSDVTQKAMLVELSVSYWTGRASDERVLDEVHKRHKIEHEHQEYRKILVKPEALNAVKAVRSRARAYHFQRTLPWLDKGTRILPAAYYLDYAETMREFHAEYEAAVATFCKNYTALRGEARRRLGDLYRDEDYPSTEAIKRKFGWSFSVMPIPSKGDWRVEMPAKESAKIKEQIDAQVAAAFSKATRDIWARLYDVVANLADKMKDTKAKFHDSIIEGIKEMVKVAGEMNIAGDAKLDAMRKEIEQKLSKLQPDVLREDKKARKSAGDAADALLAKMAGYIGEQ